MKTKKSFLKPALLALLMTGIALLLPEAIGESRSSAYAFDEDSIHHECVMDIDADADVEVYICTGPQSKRYHKTKGCRGLSSCSRQILKITLREATDEYGRTPCGYCYK